MLTQCSSATPITDQDLSAPSARMTPRNLPPSPRSRRSRPRSIWLMCDSPVLKSTMRRVRAWGGEVVLQSCDAEGIPVRPIGDAELSQIDDLLAGRGVHELVVCLHASCPIPPSSAMIPVTGAGRTGFDQMLINIRHRAGSNDRLRTAVAEQVAALERRPAVAEEIRRRGLAVSGLLYIPESGCWMHYSRDGGWSEAAVCA